MCLEFVCVFRHCFEKFLSRSSDFSSSQKQHLHIPIRSGTHKHFQTTIKFSYMENLDPHPPKSKMGGGGGSGGGERVAVSFYPVQDWSS